MSVKLISEIGRKTKCRLDPNKNLAIQMRSSGWMSAQQFRNNHKF